MKYVKFRGKNLSDLVKLSKKKKEQRFFALDKHPDKLYFFCPCNFSFLNPLHISLKLHKVLNKNPLTITPSLITHHGEGFCHFNIINGAVVWAKDTNNPIKLPGQE